MRLLVDITVFEVVFSRPVPPSPGSRKGALKGQHHLPRISTSERVNTLYLPTYCDPAFSGIHQQDGPS